MDIKKRLNFDTDLAQHSAARNRYQFSSFFNNRLVLSFLWRPIDGGNKLDQEMLEAALNAICFMMVVGIEVGI